MFYSVTCTPLCQFRITSKLTYYSTLISWQISTSLTVQTFILLLIFFTNMKPKKGLPRLIFLRQYSNTYSDTRTIFLSKQLYDNIYLYYPKIFMNFLLYLIDYDCKANYKCFFAYTYPHVKIFEC